MKHTEIEKSSAGAVSRLSDSRLELTVEVPCVLPDFLPDILRVVRCEGQALVCDRRTAADKITVDGTLKFEALCVSADGELFCATQTAAWQKSVDAELPIGSVIFDNVRVTGCRARPVNSKKIEFSANVTLQLTVFGPQQDEFLSACDRPDVQLRRLPVAVERFCGGSSRRFSVSEDLELNSDAPSVERLLGARIETADTRAAAGEDTVEISGDLKVTLLYSADVEGGIPRRVAYTLPVAQTLEVDGARRDCHCRLQLEPCAYSVTTRTGADGLVRGFSFDCTLYAAVCCTAADTLNCVCDAYSTQFESAVQSRLLSVTSGTEHLQERASLTASFRDTRLPVRVVDSSAIITAVRLQPSPESASQMTLLADVQISVTGTDADGELLHLWQQAQAAVPFTVPADAVLSPQANITGVTAAITDDGVEARVELNAAVESASVSTVDVLADLAVNEQKPHPAAAAPLILCYAAANESLFDIAKIYHTTPQAIMQHNALESDEPALPAMLVIPTL